MHPWFGVSFSKRKQLAHEMREWLRLNPDLRIKHGKAHDDGRFFCGYGVGYKDGEHWASAEVLELRREICRKNQRKLRENPEFKKQFNEYCRGRYIEKADVRLRACERQKKWAAKFPEKVAQRVAKRRAKKRAATHPDHDSAIEAALRLEAVRLGKETGIPHDVDHIIPIAHGGPHHHKNLQVLPDTINKQKSSNPFWTSDTYLDFRSVPRELWPEQLVAFYSAARLT